MLGRQETPHVVGPHASLTPHKGEDAGGTDKIGSVFRADAQCESIQANGNFSSRRADTLGAPLHCTILQGYPKQPRRAHVLSSRAQGS